MLALAVMALSALIVAVLVLLLAIAVKELAAALEAPTEVRKKKAASAWSSTPTAMQQRKAPQPDAAQAARPRLDHRVGIEFDGARPGRIAIDMPGQVPPDHIDHHRPIAGPHLLN